MIKDPYIFELANIGKRARERNVEWSLKSVNAPIGVASYKVKNVIQKEIMEKLPTEEELNLYIKKLPNDEIDEENN